MRRFEPGNDIAELHYKDLLAAGEWTRARVGQRREGQLKFLGIIIILVMNEEGLKRTAAVAMRQEKRDEKY